MLIFRIQLVENIPEHLSFHADGRPRFPLSTGFQALLDQARYSVEMVSPVWDLNAWDVEAKQVQTGPAFPPLSPADYISQVPRGRTSNYFRSGFERTLLNEIDPAQLSALVPPL